MTVNIAQHPRFPAKAVQLFLCGCAVNPFVRFRKTGLELELKRNRAPSNEGAGPRQLASGLSLHGFWLINWIRNAPRTEIQEIYQKLGDLVADGSLSAVVETVYALEQFKEAFDQSLKSSRNGKILFKFGATD